jgi:tetrahydromethanopterin S-methyltransferase subunit G
MISERLDKIDKKLDEVIENQHSLELKLTKRVDRNTLIINIIIRLALVLFIAVVTFGFTCL